MLKSFTEDCAKSRVFNPLQDILRGKSQFRMTLSTALAVYIALCPFQLFSDSSSENIFSMIICLSALFIISHYFKNNKLYEFPCSSMVILGYTFSYFVFPIIATTMEGKPLVFNLLHPNEVFMASFSTYIGLLMAHLIYQTFNPFQLCRHWLSKNFVLRAGGFDANSESFLYFCGLIGLSCTAFITFIFHNPENEAHPPYIKFIQGFQPFAYMPYLILVRSLMGGVEKKISWYNLFIYSLFIIFVGLGRNSRAAIFMGFASCALAIIFAIWLGHKKTALFSWRQAFCATLVAMIVFGPVTQFATIMVENRSNRGSISNSELALKTLSSLSEVNSSPEKNIKIKNSSTWDEYYLDNALLARLCNLKYLDSTWHDAKKLKTISKLYVNNMEWQRNISILPQPLILALGLNVDKNKATGASMGDHIHYAATDNKYVLGGFRTGSLITTAYILFGWYFPIVIGILAIPLFIICDSFSLQNSFNSLSYIISPIFLMNLFSLTFFLTSAATGAEGLSPLVGLWFRSYLQWIFLFIILKYLYSCTFSVFSVKK